MLQHLSLELVLPPMNGSELLRLATEIRDWYWQFGVHRAGDYHLSPVRWLKDLYNQSAWLESSLPAYRQSRPAMAIWGPSQTGKSTSISAYMDGDSPLSGDLHTEGTGTGLHWDGGLTFRFMAPIVENLESIPPHMARRVLNPFNKGSDGSSCLTRFTAGSLKPVAGRTHVRFPRFPVGLSLVSPKDLWHALARGYSSECAGPGMSGRQTRWDLPKFKKALADFRKAHQATLPRLKEGQAPIDRKAFERLTDFIEVMEDLASIQDKSSNFYELADQKDAWRAALNDLLQEPVLCRSVEHTELFAAKILWDGLPKLSEHYNAMVDLYERLAGHQGDWQGRTVYCSLEAAALFLNMSAPEIALKTEAPHPDSNEGNIMAMIHQLQWSVQDDVILIGCDPQMSGTPLGNDPMAFARLQSLVWELTVPVNLENLSDQPFADQPQRRNALKDFLEVSDMLDFAGVGNDRTTDPTRLVTEDEIIWERERQGQPVDKDYQLTPINFFKNVLKRGKTASIVTTYAKRLNIDGFAIFLGLRKDPCTNADQLNQGIDFWWKYNLPDYFANRKGPSPRPLNLVLTFWAEQLNHANDPKDGGMYNRIKQHVEKLGPLRDPEIVTTFAVNNHRSPDGAGTLKHDFLPGSERYATLFRIKDFKTQFKLPISQQSFDAMLTDLDTGGAEFFFQQARQQMQLARKDGERNRLDDIAEGFKQAQKRLQALLRERDLIPEERPKDTRRDHLEAFAKRCRERIKDLAHDAMKRANLGLRELLNVRAEKLTSIPSNPMLIDKTFLSEQFKRWKEDQLDRFADPKIRGLWELLGISRKDSLEEFLQAIIASITVAPEIDRLSGWLEGLVQHHNRNTASIDLRRQLGIQMSNLIHRDLPDPDNPFRSFSAAKSATISHEAGMDSSLAQLQRGTRCPFYRVYMKDFLDPDARLDQLIRKEVIPVRRPDQPGDVEIANLAKVYHLLD